MLLALLELWTLCQVHAPGEDCFTFCSSWSEEQDYRIPRGQALDRSPNKPVWIFVPFLWNLSFPRKGTKALKRMSVSFKITQPVGAEGHKMSRFPLPNSSSFPRDTFVPCCWRDLSLLRPPPPSKCELAQGHWSSLAI